MQASGVYVITEARTGRRYVGSAVDIRTRLRSHWNALRKGRHHSKYMQRVWDKYGEGCLEARVLLLCGKENLLFYEQRALDALTPEFNTCKMAGSTLGVPASQKAKRLAAARARDRVRNNPEEHMRITLKANEASREKWSCPVYKAKRVRKMVVASEPLRKKITFNGVTKTRQEWAEHLGITPSTLDYRLQNWGKEAALTTKGVGKHTKESYLLRSRRKGRTLFYKGEERTVTEIAEMLGVSRQAILYHARRKSLQEAVSHFEDKLND